MSEQRYPIKDSIRKQAHISAEQYQAMYQRSINEPDQFWSEMAERITWHKTPEQIKDCSFAQDDLHIKWFEDGVLNASENCLDRHLESRGDKAALIWEADEEGQASRQFTYKELHQEVCKLANGLKSLGVGKGDVVTLYMPMVPEAMIAMYACARLGAVHSVVFGGFAPHELAVRIEDAEPKVVIAASCGAPGSLLP